MFKIFVIHSKDFLFFNYAELEFENFLEFENSSSLYFLNHLINHHLSPSESLSLSIKNFKKERERERENFVFNLNSS